MMSNDLTQVERVDGEEDGLKVLSLGPPWRTRGRELEPIMVTNCPVGEMRLTPSEAMVVGKVVEEAGQRCQRQMTGPGK